ncbi:SGNH/GDSL hydrolase family protein [Ferruginibacter profundus]
MTFTFYRIAAGIAMLFVTMFVNAGEKNKSKQLHHPGAVEYKKAISPLTTPYGTIYSANSWSNTNDFITHGNVTATLSGNYVNISSSTKDDWNNTVHITSYQTKLEKWRFKLRFKIAAWAADSYGLGFGLKSANAFVQNDVMGFLQTTNSGSGGLYIVKSGRTIVATGPTINFALNDTIDLDGEFYDSVFHFTAHNISSGSMGSVSFTYATNGSTIAVPNTSNFSLMELGGTHQVQNIEITSNEPTGANLVTVGDSKTIGYFTNTFTGRYAAQLNNNYPPALINAGGADLVTNVLNRQDELTRLSANKYLLSIGSNDIRFGSTLLQLQSNYDSLVRILQATGAKVYHIVLPEDYSKPLGVNMLAFKDWVAATYPAYYINVWDSMATGNVLKGIYDTGDGVHLNQQGNNKIYEAIVASNKLNNVTLPVDALFFTGEQTGGHQVTLNWKVDPGQQPATFSLLKSFDGNSFEQVAVIAAHSAVAYTYTDNDFTSPVSYYKLKITENPGLVRYSDIIVVRNDRYAAGISGMQKIAENEYAFVYYTNENSTISWQVIDLNGRKMSEGKQQLYKGRNNIKVAVANSSKGVYYLNIALPGKNMQVVLAFIK